MRLSKSVTDHIENNPTDTFVSIASLWEISIKTSIGKLPLNTSLESIINDFIYADGLKILAIQPKHVLKVMNLPLHHKDPFDRILAAQVLVDGLSFATRDPLFDSYGIQRFW